MSYFKQVQSLDDLKEQFKKLARTHHPDAGGDAEIMKQINQEYDTLFPIWKHRYNMSTEQPTEETAYSTRSRFYTENGWEGENYDSKLTLKEIAKIVRKYVKETYPTYKFSVRTKYASMVQELHVDLLESPIEIYKTFDELTDDDKLRLIKKAESNGYFHLTSWNDSELQEELERIWAEHGNFYKCLNNVTDHVISDVDNFVKSYNYDDSDAMIDYFDNNFYYFGCAQNNGMDIKIVPKTARVKEKGNAVNKTVTPESAVEQEQMRYDIEKTKHTKTGEDIWLVKIKDNMERTEFLQEKQKMSELGGYYSKYTHSFIFKEDPGDKLNGNLEKEMNVATKMSEGNYNSETSLTSNQDENSEEKQEAIEESIELPETFEDWKKLGFVKTRLVHNLEVELSIPNKECITRYWGDMGEYEFKVNVSEQKAFERYSKLRKLSSLSQQIENVKLSDFEWDEDNYLHFTAEAGSYEFKGLFGVFDPQHGINMELINIDDGNRYLHPQIELQWDSIEQFLKEYSIERYKDIKNDRENLKEEQVVYNETNNDFKLEQVSVRLNKEAALYSNQSIETAADAVQLVGQELMSKLDREQICIINLNSANNPINFSVTSIGTLNHALAEPREMLKASILSNAGSVIMLHNHPSSDLNPSQEDYQMTMRMVQSFESVGIKVLDHVIIGGNNTQDFYSMRDENVRLFEGYQPSGGKLELLDIGEHLIREIEVFLVAEDLTYWINNTYSTIFLTNEEAELILNYMDGHGYNLGVENGELVRIDVDEETPTTENYNINEAIYAVCDWNADLIEDTHENINVAASFEEVYELRKYMQGLREDEKVINEMFKKTKLGKTLKLGIENPEGKKFEPETLKEEKNSEKQRKKEKVM